MEFAFGFAVAIIFGVFLLIPILLMFGGSGIEILLPIKRILIKFGLITGLVRMKNIDEDLR